MKRITTDEAIELLGVTMDRYNQTKWTERGIWDQRGNMVCNEFSKELIVRRGGDLITVKKIVFTDKKRKTSEAPIFFVAKEETLNEQNLIVTCDNVKEPTRSHNDDAGLDFYVPDNVSFTIEPGEIAPLDLGVSICIQKEGYFGLLTGRSGHAKKGISVVSSGIIDIGYRGRLSIELINNGTEPFAVEAGMRMVQLVIVKNASLPVQVVSKEVYDRFPSERGDKGFGSTNEKS